MNYSDLKPGQRYTRPLAVKSTRELICVAPHPYLATTEWACYGFDPKTGQLVGSGSREYPVELAPAKKGTDNCVVLTDDEVRLIECVLANTGGDLHALVRGAIDKIRAFGLSRDRPSYKLIIAGTSYRVGFQGGNHGAIYLEKE